MPGLQCIGLLGLQANHRFAAADLEVLVIVEALLCRPIEFFEVREIAGTGAAVLQLGQQHSELGAPVAHVVLTDYRVTLGFEYACQTVADDGAA